MLVLYLIYTLIQALYDVKLAPDFYTILGVSPSTTTREVKSRFRRLAARFHPDKISQKVEDFDPTTDDAFLRLKLAQDTLTASAKRFAYDRFGPGIVKYTPHPNDKLHTKRDFVYAGLRSFLPEYIQGGVTLIVLNYFWFPKYGQFWRYLAVLAVAVLELTLLTHDWTPPRAASILGSTLYGFFPDFLPSHLLPFQILAIARRMSISINIFISQLAPPRSHQAGAQAAQNEVLMGHLSQAVVRVDQEANSLLNLGFAPYKGDREMVDRLRGSMTEGITLGTLRQTPEVRAAVTRALDRRKAATENSSPGVTEVE